jgi:hypothetical protein
VIQGALTASVDDLKRELSSTIEQLLELRHRLDIASVPTPRSQSQPQPQPQPTPPAESNTHASNQRRPTEPTVGVPDARTPTEAEELAAEAQAIAAHILSNDAPLDGSIRTRIKDLERRCSLAMVGAAEQAERADKLSDGSRTPSPGTPHEDVAGIGSDEDWTKGTPKRCRSRLGLGNATKSAGARSPLVPRLLLSSHGYGGAQTGNNVMLYL